MNDRTVAALIDEVVAEHRRSTARLRERLRRDAARDATAREADARSENLRAAKDAGGHRAGIEPIMRSVRDRATPVEADGAGQQESVPQRPARWLS